MHNYIRLIVIALFVLGLQAVGFSEEMPEVYIYKIENGRIHLKTDPGQEAREIRRMELIPNGLEVILKEDTVAYLTCPGCRIEKITGNESPYTVNAKKIRKDEANAAKIIGYFTSALKEFVYPDSKIGKRVSMHVRGGGNDPGKDSCESIVPQDHEDILPIGETIVFQWPLSGDNFKFEIKNISNNMTICSQDTNKNKIEVPMKNFSAGYVYKWVIETKASGLKCSASFSVLSQEEAEEIANNIDEIMKLLPPDIDEDTKLRVKAGYLLSEGLVYNAKTILSPN